MEPEDDLRPGSKGAPTHWAIVAAVAAVILLLWASGRESTQQALKGQAPGFSLPIVGQADRQVRLDQLRGKVIALVFWSNRGDLVKQSLRFWQYMHEKHAGDGLVVLGMCLDQDEPEALAYARQRGLTFPHLFVDRPTASAYGVTGVPASIVVDRDSQVRMVYPGWTPTTPGQLADGLTRWLQAAPAEAAPATQTPVRTGDR